MSASIVFFNQAGTIWGRFMYPRRAGQNGDNFAKFLSI
jgi:hypothetical protein